jgi:peptide deformylase
MELLYYPHEFLDKQVNPFDFNNPIQDPKEIKKEMLEIMYDKDGVGISANQVGIDAQVFVMGSKHVPDKSAIFFNPKVVEASQETITDVEGCLSFPGIFVKVKRPAWIIAEFQDENGETKRGKILEYDARCYLHELDHLLGITYKDRVSKLKWDMAVKKSQKQLLKFKKQGIQYA